MKNILLAVLFTTFFCCQNTAPESLFIKAEEITELFTVTDIVTAKRSKVVGYINYKGILVKIDNGLSGYYHKKYNLSVGDIITVKLYVSYYYTYDGYELKFGNLDLKKYEIK